MIVRELKEKLSSLPDDAIINIGIFLNINGQTADLSRKIDSVIYHPQNNLVSLNNNWPIQFFY